MRAEQLDEAAVRALPWEGIVPLAQVLHHVLPAYGGKVLTEALWALCREPSEQEIISVLADELRRAPGRLFEEPLRIYFTEPEDWDDADRALYGGRPVLPRIGNGMHRAAAAVVAGAEQIRVTVVDWETVPSPFGGELVEVSYRLRTGPPSTTTLPSDDACDFSFSWLRSFRLTTDAWVEAATQGGSGDLSEAIYHCPHRLRADLLRALRARAARHGLRLRVVRARPVTWEELDQEDGD